MLGKLGGMDANALRLGSGGWALLVVTVACGPAPQEGASGTDGSTGDTDGIEVPGEGSGAETTAAESSAGSSASVTAGDGDGSGTPTTSAGSEAGSDGTSDEGSTGNDSQGGSEGDSGSTGGSTGGGDDCTQTFIARVRDFQDAHPDFQYVIGVDPGIVEEDIGPDDKPVYAGDPTTPTTTGVENFNQWYNDVDGVNQPFDIPLTVTEIEPGIYQYDNSAFFPIDDQGWGNEGRAHNYHFTLELHTDFVYEGGEVFTFEGDDDLWVFVNGKLGIDLGGVHSPLEGTIDMDAMAEYLGIEPGNEYSLDFFFAERHTSQSNFKITTSIGCFVPVPQ